ncbi:Protein ArsC [Pirellulimonas nuda]|uniref:Protein ArsC n=1 Tax=Pirellulimonas nuda TaxID=2528009 RepID=A0A518D6D5_9BACT|nr:protein-tyrosine-phosphatase [Pirellulimonas nuda]QDU87042.1 Protein ArsC [Pirellulimonas nuda]
MKTLLIPAALVAGVLVAGLAAAQEEVAMYPELASYIDARIAEFEQIPAERRTQLAGLAEYVTACGTTGKPARLTFICTHNSRRSHMAQLWAAVAAARYGVGGVETFSGGTEATAFNPRAVAAMRRAGLEIVGPEAEPNPRYEVRLAAGATPMACFSKVYDQSPNPAEGFCAVMTCSHADENCPVVSGADQRLVIEYKDPKAADDTPREAATYDERSAQIAREMLYAFAQVKK